MIDVENEIFTEVADAVQAEYPNCLVTSEYTPGVPSFPCVSLVEVDNASWEESMTQEGADVHAAVTYELNVYSNKMIGKKLECREIASFVDNLLLGMNFTRMMLQPIPNMSDATIYRITGRYRVLVDTEHVLYRR